MTPILYDVSYVTSGSGFGHLSDCISCDVTEERNGAYEATLVYPASGIHFDELKPERITNILVNKNTSGRKFQLFRIYKMSRPMDQDGQMICTFYLKHISYDLDGYTVMPGLYTGTAAEVMEAAIATSPLTNTTFSFETDSPLEGIVEVKTPCTFRKFLGGMEGSVLDKFGGELEFDNFTVKHHVARGNINNKLGLRYGKNIIELSQEIDSTNIYTHVLPYAVKNVGGIESIVYASGSGIIQLTEDYAIGRQRILPLDVTDQFKEAEDITVGAVRAAATRYITEHDMTGVVPSINCKFADFRNFIEYGNIPADEVGLCDYAEVYFPAYRIREDMKIVKTTFDALREEYTDIELGTQKKTVAKTIASQTKQIKSLFEKISVLQQLRT